MISDTWATSSSAAMRGAAFLPKPVAGKTMCEYALARPTTSAATFSAVCPASCGASACSTLATPAICVAALAAPCALCPATSTCMSPPIFCAAAMVLNVAPLGVALSCSAMTRVVMMCSNHFGFVAQLGDQFLHVGNFAAAFAFGRLDHF